jgi:hypothetical protein
VSVPADPDLSSVKREICDANDYPGDGENVGGNVGIHKLVQIVEEESALVRLDSAVGFEPIFQQSQWTRPRKHFGKDSPEKRSDVQPPKNRAGARQQSTENHPQNEKRVEEENGDRECRIETRSNKG